MEQRLFLFPVTIPGRKGGEKKITANRCRSSSTVPSKGALSRLGSVQPVKPPKLYKYAERAQSFGIT